MLLAVRLARGNHDFRLLKLSQLVVVVVVLLVYLPDGEQKQSRLPAGRLARPTCLPELPTNNKTRRQIGQRKESVLLLLYSPSVSSPTIRSR